MPHKSYDNEEVSLELLERLRKQASKMHSELNDLGVKEFKEKGTLTGAVLNEKVNEYEQLRMTIQQLENRLLE